MCRLLDCCLEPIRGRDSTSTLEMSYAPNQRGEMLPSRMGAHVRNDLVAEYVQLIVGG